MPLAYSTLEDRRRITQELEDKAILIVNAFLQKDKEIRRRIHQEFLAEGERFSCSLVPPEGWRDELIKDTLQALYEFIGIPENYFN